MTLSQLINRPCTLIRRTSSGSVDRYGDADQTPTEANAVWEVQQRSRDELDDAQISDALWDGFFLPGTELDTGDAVRDLELGTFELVGAPWPVRNPRTQTASHVEATLRKIAGAEDAS